MNHYGYESMEDLQKAIKRHEVTRNIVVVILGAVLLALVIIMSSCSMTLNIASDGQPVQVIYKNSDGKME